MIRGIHHLGIHTRDLDRMRSFYEQAFGFEVVGEELQLADVPVASLVTGVPDAVARVLMMRTSNAFVELFEWSSPEGEPLRPLRPHDYGYTHFCVDVTDIDAEYERLTGLGATFVHPSPVRMGDMASVYGKDPDGNLFELGEIPPGNIYHRDGGE
ncbi:VOC family protein [Actinophytocola sediminis]